MSKGMNDLKSFHGYRIDLSQKVLWREEEPCELPVKAVELLCALIENEGRIVSKDELLDRIWPDSFVEENILSQNVYLLRKTFREHGVAEELIQTVPRRGYRFAGEVSDAETFVEVERIDRQLIGAAGISEEEFRELLARIRTGAEPDEAAVARTETPGPAAEPASERRRRISPLHFAAGIVLTALAAAFFFLFVYPKYEREQSAGIPPVGTGDLKYAQLSESARVVAVGLSPDDQHAAYAVHTSGNKYKLVLRHLPTGSETVVIQPQERHIYCIRFSPDGNYIYYGGGHHEKPLTVFRIPLYGGISEPVLDDLAHMFSISPDGEWLSFFRRVPEEGAHYIEIARSRDGSERRTVTLRKGDDSFAIWGSSPEWSPDGTKLVAAAAVRYPGNSERPVRSFLVEVDVATGAQEQISKTDWHTYHEPYWSPDGRGIYTKFRTRRGEPVQIGYVDRRTGQGRRITNDSNDYREFRAASDGRFLVTVVWSKSENLFLVPANGNGRVRQLTYDTRGQNGADGLAWMPDGKRLVYTRTNGFGIGNIWMIDPETGRTRQITNDARKAHKIIDVTPDGRTLLYTSNRSGQYHVWRTDLDGTNTRQLTEGGDAELAELSADGRWFYYARDGLWKKPVAGGEPVRVTKMTARLARFSPTDPGSFQAYIHDDADKKKNPWKYVVFKETDPGRYRELEIPAIRVYDWLPDGSGIYYVDNGESFNNVWKISLETGGVEKVTDFQDQRISNVSLSPDGQTLAVSRGQAVGNLVRIEGLGE